MPRAKNTWETLPVFPSPSVRARITELGYGSGLWTRAELDERWGRSVANKLIDEAKEYGWLVSPFRGEFWVPTARDLMVVSWLPRSLRDEFILSRALYASGVRFWCFSSWARDRGLLLPRPLFVTDLSARGVSVVSDPPPLDELQRDLQSRLPRVRRMPFLDDLLIVPRLGQTSHSLRPRSVALPLGQPRIVPGFTMQDIEEDRARSGGGAASSEAVAPATIQYSVSPTMEDPGWLVAFLIALDLGRTSDLIRGVVDEALAKRADRKRGTRYEEDILDAAQRWAGYFGQPLPSDEWRSLLATPRLPFFLVPRDVWKEVISSGLSRAYGKTQALKEGLPRARR